MSKETQQQQCGVCSEGFESGEDNMKKCTNPYGKVYHDKCNVCVQCFRPFDETYGTEAYEVDGRQYCEYDYQQLYAPMCSKCNLYIQGRLIKAMNARWHAECFTCAICDAVLADCDQGFVINAGRALCKTCKPDDVTKSSGGRYMCKKCHTYIDKGAHIMYMGDPVHPWHYACAHCQHELDETCRKRGNELYCLKCHNKMGAVPICATCKQPIEDARVVNALGKQFHVDHFCCAHCARPFYGNRYYEKTDFEGHRRAYCETHYNQYFGDRCFVCNKGISRDVISALNKTFCADHFTCIGCNVKLTARSKFHDFDLRPLCLRCHEKLPSAVRRRIKLHTEENKVAPGKK